MILVLNGNILLINLGRNIMVNIALIANIIK